MKGIEAAAMQQSDKPEEKENVGKYSGIGPDAIIESSDGMVILQ